MRVRWANKVCSSRSCLEERERIGWASDLGSCSRCQGFGAETRAENANRCRAFRRRSAAPSQVKAQTASYTRKGHPNAAVGVEGGCRLQHAKAATVQTPTEQSPREVGTSGFRIELLVTDRLRVWGTLLANRRAPSQAAGGLCHPRLDESLLRTPHRFAWALTLKAVLLNPKPEYPF